MFDWDDDNNNNTTYIESELALGFPNATPAASVGDVASSYANSTAAVSSNVDPMLLRLRYICEVWITLPIAIAGIIGNLVSIFVLRQYKPAMTTTIILQCLAWTDTAYLTASVILRPFRYIGIPNYETYVPYIFFWLHPTMYVIRLTGAWLTVLLTVDRFIAVCYPLHASRLCSRAKTSILILIIALCSFAFSVPRYFEYIIINPTNETLRRSTPESWLMKNHSYTFTYRLALFFIAMYLVPMTTVTILNTRLLITFRRSAKNRATSLCVNSFTSTSTHSSSSDRSFSTKASCSSSSCSSSAYSSSFCSMTRTVTAVSVTVVLISIATDTVAMLSHSLWSIEQVFPHLRTAVSYYRKYLSNFSNVAVTLRCALNFVVYCAVSRQFRVVLYRSLVCSSRAPTSTRGIGHHHHRRQAAPQAGRQSSKASDKISTSILSLLLTGQRQKASSSPSPVFSPNGVVDENGCRVEASPFNHALVTFVKR